MSNIFDDLDSAVAGLKQDCEGFLAQIRKQGEELGQLRERLNGRDQCISVMNNELAAKDREIAELKSILKAEAVEVTNAEIQKLRAELKAVNERLKEAKDLLRDVLRICNFGFGLAEISLRLRTIAFLDPPAPKVGKSQKCHHLTINERWPKCQECGKWYARTIFDGAPLCVACIQSMLGAPVRAK